MLQRRWAETKIHISRAIDESTFANATRGGSCAHPDQSRGLARRRNLRAISGVGASSPILLFFLGGGVALHERLVGKSRAISATPKISAETIALIQEMARNNRLWGAERIRGELLKLDIRVCKRTIQKYMRGVRTKPPRGQKWSTDLEQPCRPDLGLRLPPGQRSVVSTARRPSSSSSSRHDE
jgi:hypothetical protein